MCVLLIQCICVASAVSVPVDHCHCWSVLLLSHHTHTPLGHITADTDFSFVHGLFCESAVLYCVNQLAM